MPITMSNGRTTAETTAERSKLIDRVTAKMSDPRFQRDLTAFLNRYDAEEGASKAGAAATDGWITLPTKKERCFIQAWAREESESASTCDDHRTDLGPPLAMAAARSSAPHDWACRRRSL